MSGTTAPGAVVQRSPRWILFGPLAAGGFIEAGLVAASLVVLSLWIASS
jgi:hypothetical protein